MEVALCGGGERGTHTDIHRNASRMDKMRVARVNALELPVYPVQQERAEGVRKTES